MEFVIGAAVVIVLIFAGGLYMQKKAEQRLVEKIRSRFGLVPEIEYSFEKYNSIAFYFKEMSKKCPEDETHTLIDDGTWHDLDMDKVFITMDATQSSIGEEYLYYVLRTPALRNEELKDREKLIGFFAENEEKRVRVQKELAKAGKIDKISVYEYLSSLENLESENNFSHFMSIILLSLAVASIFVLPGIGIIATIGVFFYNVITYFKRKGRIENYYVVVAYLLRTIELSQRLCSIEDETISSYTDRMKEQIKSFKNVTKGATLIVSKKSNGDFLEIAFDYIRMATHIDLIRFNVMLEKLKNRKEDFDVIFETVGLIDSMAAVASFRKLMGAWCRPELSVCSMQDHADGLGIRTENIYHPMILDPVKNDFSESGNVLLTGSNASGKSTFIKTIAINSILAQSINTVMADSYSACFFKCMTSMALTDNLSDGESYYIVEIKSLKRICDSLNERVPLLIFIDEVLRGTNTLERIAASSRILSYVGKKNCMLFAATHDIELTYILENSFRMYHFEETVGDDNVNFDYKLKNGRAVTRNAILLLKMLGFEKEITDEAGLAADHYIESGEWDVIQS